MARRRLPPAAFLIALAAVALCAGACDSDTQTSPTPTVTVTAGSVRPAAIPNRGHLFSAA